MAKSLSKHGMLGIVLLLFFWTLPASGYEVTDLTQLTNGSIAETGCAFNADSTKIAYRNMHSPYSWDNCDIWVMNTNGSSKTQITTDSRGEFDPRFAPDGRITYTKEFGSNDYDLWIVNGDGSSPHSLIGGSYRQTTCRWHPSGNKLVYCSEYQYQGPSEIWTANADGTSQTQLTDHIVDGYGQGNPVYSRSGNLIAYANYATNGEQPHIWIMNADGSGKQQITSGTEGQNPMFWWPDDSKIGYTRDGDVWLHNLSTGADEFLFSMPSGSINWCDLSSDGTKLVFDAPDNHIWIGSITSELQPDLIVNSLTIDTNPIMQPDSTTIHCTIANQGSADATPVNYWLRIRLCASNDYNDVIDYVAGRQITINLGPGATRTEVFNFNSGSYPTGNFYLVAMVDAYDIVTESFETNNTNSLPITIEPFVGHTVQGYVKYSTGVGFSGVTVRLTENGENRIKDTQADGYYYFYNVADAIDPYTVTAEKTGWEFTNNPQEAIVTGDHVWLDDMLGSLLPPEETISKPGTPTGEINPVENISYAYATSGAESNLGHTVEYQFDWDASGAHDYSAWSTSTSASHSWSSTGERQIRVTARCQTHTDKNNISDPLTVTVIPDEPPPPAKKRLIIDTDPAMGDSDPDDNTALIYALQSPDLCTVEGITYGYGNFGGQLPDSDGTRGANRMLDYYQLQLNKIIEVLQEAGAIDTVPPIYRGHKESETWDNDDDHLPNNASIFINDTVKNNPNEITIVALGTLTNIAIAMQHYNNGQGGLGPVAFMEDCKELWIIGGASIGKFDLQTGNVATCDEIGCSFGVAEWNIWRDKKAAEYVFKYSVLDETETPKIKMVPLNATMRWLIETSDISTVEDAQTRITNYLSFPLRWWINEANPYDCRQVADPINFWDWIENGALAIARGCNLAGGVPDLSSLYGLDWQNDYEDSFEAVLAFMADIPSIGPSGFPPYDTIGMVLALKQDDPTFWKYFEDHKVYVSLFLLNAGETIEDDALPDREKVRIFYNYTNQDMTDSIVDQWTETEHHNPPQNKEFIECSDADYVKSSFLGLSGPINVSQDFYRHLPVGYSGLNTPIEPDTKYRGRIFFDINLPNNTSVTEVKLHIYCDTKKDWTDTQHRVSLYRCDPDENDPAVIWASAVAPNAYITDTHIGTLQAWRTVTLGGSAVSDFQQTVATCGTQFGVLLAEDGDDDSCVWFDTSKDWKAYLEVTFDACPIGDISGDCQVDFTDFGILANQWLQAPGCPSADIAPDGGDGLVDISDIALLTKHWLEGTTP